VALSQQFFLLPHLWFGNAEEVILVYVIMYYQTLGLMFSSPPH